MVKKIFSILFALLVLLFGVITPSTYYRAHAAIIPPPPEPGAGTACPGDTWAGTITVSVIPSDVPISGSFKISYGIIFPGTVYIEIYNKLETARLFQAQIEQTAAGNYSYTLAANQIQTVQPGTTYLARVKLHAGVSTWWCGQRLFFVLNEEGGHFTAPDKELDYGFTTLRKVEVRGVPDAEYKFKLSGQWRGSFLSINGDDTFNPNAFDLIDINWICNNGEANRLTDGDNPCKDTFLAGTYKIDLVVASTGAVIESYTFKVKVKLTEAGGGGEEPRDLPKTIPTPFGPIDATPEGLARAFLSLGIGAAGGVAFLMMVFGAYRLIFAGGNPESIQEGRSVMTAAIAGLIVVILAIFLLDLIGISILGLVDIV